MSYIEPLLRKIRSQVLKEDSVVGDEERMTGGKYVDTANQ
jgi:hypothetical protein